MSTPVNEQHDAPAGYRSVGAKSSFQNGVLIATIAFFLLSTGLPTAISIGTSFSSSRRMMAGPIITAVTSASPQYAFAAGRIWYLAVSPDTQSQTLRSIPLPSDPNAVTETDDDEPSKIKFPLNGSLRLLGQEKKLWIIDADRIGWVEDGTFMADLPQRRLGEFSQPFLFRDKPAVLEFVAGNAKRRAGVELLVLTDGEWDSAGFLRVDDGTAVTLPEWRVVPLGETLYVFRAMGNSLVEYLEWPIAKDAAPAATDAAEPVKANQPDDRWKRIVIAPNQPQSTGPRNFPGAVHWAAAELDGALVVFHQQLAAAGTGTGGKIVGKKYQDGKWTDFFSFSQATSVSFMQSISVCRLPGPSHFALIYPETFSKLQIVEVENGNVVATTSQGQANPFSGAFPMPSMGQMIFLQALTLSMTVVFVLVIGRLFAKHRAPEYIYGLGCVPFASLERRAAARVIDSLIGSAPLTYVSFLLFSEFDFEKLFGFVIASQAPTELLNFLIGLAWRAGIAFGWMFLTFLVFSFTEGWWGITVGKAILGIRALGADLHPCGFWRALLRNLMRIADMFYNGLVGILAIAFSTNQQRLGDMVARTVVVRAVPIEHLPEKPGSAATTQPSKAPQRTGVKNNETENFWQT